MFDRPDPHRMQYYSMQPISFNTLPTSSSVTTNLPSSNYTLAPLPNGSSHSLAPIPQSLTQLHLNQMNCAQEVAFVLQKNLPTLGSRRYRNRAQSLSETVKDSAVSMSKTFCQVCLTAVNNLRSLLRPVYQMICFTYLKIQYMVYTSILAIFNYRIAILHNLSIKDVCVLAQEIERRIINLRNWPHQYITLNTRKRDWASITSYHPDYIRFHNSMWLVVNELIFGIAISSYVLENNNSLSNVIIYYSKVYTIDWVSRMMWWLKGWPAGLKLNSELASFLGDLFLWLIDFWQELLQIMYPHLPAVITAIGLSGFCGASISLSMMSDLLSALTLHLYIFYVASAKIYAWQLTILVSLFHLFRGKKKNVLRDRIDSCDYDLDQLLLGTILFTLLAFLFPTVVVFYLTFAAARIAVMGFKAALHFTLVLLNQFPLFAILLRLKDAKRLPGMPLRTTAARLTIVQAEFISSWYRVPTRIRQSARSRPLGLRICTSRYATLFEDFCNIYSRNL